MELAAQYSELASNKKKQEET